MDRVTRTNERYERSGKSCSHYINYYHQCDRDRYIIKDEEEDILQQQQDQEVLPNRIVLEMGVVAVIADVCITVLAFMCLIFFSLRQRSKSKKLESDENMEIVMILFMEDIIFHDLYDADSRGQIPLK